MALEVVCELVLPRLMAAIVDTGIPAGGRRLHRAQGHPHGAPGAGGHGLRRAGLPLCRPGGAGLRREPARKHVPQIQTFSFADIDRFSSASLITRLTNDVNVLHMMVAMGLRIFVRAPVMMLASLFIVVRMKRGSRS